MNRIILSAIQQQHRFSFTYKGEFREVEPHTYGRLSTGEDALCAWQISGGSGMGFRLFLLKDMGRGAEEPTSFDAPRPGYHRDDKRFATVFAQL